MAWERSTERFKTWPSFAGKGTIRTMRYPTSLLLPKPLQNTIIATTLALAQLKTHLILTINKVPCVFTSSTYTTIPIQVIYIFRAEDRLVGGRGVSNQTFLNHRER